MIDLYKYAKKNSFYKYLIKNFLRINIDLLSEPFFFNHKIDLKIKKNFFYEYQRKFPITKWSGSNIKEHYQSNHDLQKLKCFQEPIKKIENYLNLEIKKKIIENNSIGKFKIKSLWFTIQKKNQGHSLHNHPKSIISGVYYFSIDHNKGGEIEIFKENNKIIHSPQSDDLLLLHSNIYHSVKPYMGDNDRISIAWDAIYTF